MQRSAIIWIFGDWLAKVEGLSGPIVNGQGEVVGSDGARDGVPERLDGFDGLFCGRVLEHDAKPGEIPV